MEKERKWTPEPWELYGRNVECLTSNPPQARISWEDWKRARACVNACRDMDNPDALPGLLELAWMQANSHHAECDRADIHMEGQHCDCGASKMIDWLELIGYRNQPK